jgi:hypothetical protein
MGTGGGNHVTAPSLSRGASRTDPMTARQSELRRDSATSTAEAGWSERKPPFGEPRSAEEPRELERLRTREHERGRHAAHPLQIPWLGWKDILWRTYREMQSDRLFSIAAGVVANASLGRVGRVSRRRNPPLSCEENVGLRFA